MRSFESFSIKCNHCSKLSFSTVFLYSRTAIRSDWRKRTRFFSIHCDCTGNHTWIAVFAICKMIGTNVLTFARFIQMLSSVSIDDSQLTHWGRKRMLGTNTREIAKNNLGIPTSVRSNRLLVELRREPWRRTFLSHDRNRFVDENQDYSLAAERSWILFHAGIPQRQGVQWWRKTW